MSSALPPLPFRFRRKSSSASDAPDSPVRSWFRESISCSPTSSPPASSSPPPMSPFMSKQQPYTRIAASPPFPTQLNFPEPADMIDDMAMDLGVEYRWNSSIKSPTTHCRLPSFRSSFPSDEDIPYISDCDMTESSHPRKLSQPLPRPKFTPRDNPVFYSDSEDDDEGFEFPDTSMRSTYFNVSAERGRWATDPMPRPWLRSSAPASTGSSRPVDSQPDVQSRTVHNDTNHDAAQAAPETPSAVVSSRLEPSGSPSPSVMARPLTPIVPAIEAPSIPSASSTSLSSNSITSNPSLDQSILSTELPSPTLSHTPHDGSNDETSGGVGAEIAQIPVENTSSIDCIDRTDLSVQWSQDKDSTAADENPPSLVISNDIAHVPALPEDSPLPTLTIPAIASVPVPASVLSDWDDALSTISSLSPVSSRCSSPLGPLDAEDDAMELSSHASTSDTFMADASAGVTEASASSSTPSADLAIKSAPTPDEDKENRGANKASTKARAPKRSSGVDGSVAKESRKAKRKPKDLSDDGPVRKKAKAAASDDKAKSKKSAKSAGKAKSDGETSNNVSDASSEPRDIKPKRLKPPKVKENASSSSSPVEPSDKPSSPSASPLPDTESITKPPLDEQTAALDTEILGLIIESLAVSRASSQTITMLYKSIMQTRPALKSQKEDSEWMDVFLRVLSSGDEAEGGSGIFGKVGSSHKDDMDDPLEAKWFYVPEKDEDVERATLIRNMMPRPGKRSVTKKYKQYYYQPLGKISRWDHEDEL